LRKTYAIQTQLVRYQNNGRLACGLGDDNLKYFKE